MLSDIDRKIERIIHEGISRWQGRRLFLLPCSMVYARIYSTEWGEVFLDIYKVVML